MRKGFVGSMCAVWFALALCGTWYMWKYASTPGKAAAAPTLWPTASKLPLSQNGDTLIMAVHPHCPCSRASLDELAQLLSRHDSNLKTYVLLVKPPDARGDWAHTDLANSARALPHATVILDEDGVEAKRLDAQTSGQTYLFNSHGKLLFQGGITAARGHSGDNDGIDALDAFLAGRESKSIITPVFGCPIFDDSCQQPAHSMRATQ